MYITKVNSFVFSYCVNLELYNILRGEYPQQDNSKTISTLMGGVTVTIYVLQNIKNIIKRFGP